MVSAVVVACVLGIVLIGLPYYVAQPDESAVARCLARSMEGKRYKAAKGKSFHLNYGDAGLEAFNVLSGKQIKQLEALADCVQSVFPRFFALTEADTEGFYKFGGGNVTYVTGTLHFALPDVARDILLAADSILHEADWLEPRTAFGIRHAYILSFEGLPVSEHRKLLDSQRPQPSFTVMPKDMKEKYDRERKEKVMQSRIQEQSRMKQHIQVVPDTEYVLVVALSDRNDFVGGDVLVEHSGRLPPQRHHQPQHHSHHASHSEHEAYDDDIEEITKAAQQKSSAAEDLKVPRLVPGQGIETLTPEKGSVLLIPGRKPFGFDAVTYGTRKVLVVELWRFKDAPLSSTRPTVEQGVKLGEAAPETRHEL